MMKSIVLETLLIAITLLSTDAFAWSSGETNSISRLNIHCPPLSIASATREQRCHRRRRQQLQPLRSSSSPFDFLFPRSRNSKDVAAEGDGERKNGDDGSSNISDEKLALLTLLSKVPPNVATPKDLTREILRAVSVLESNLPTPEPDVLPKLAGNWELLWTAQDASSLQDSNANNPFATFINPLENQSYSNNPTGGGGGGRSNPILPQNIQDGLEDMGILAEEQQQSTIVSTQAIDLKKGRIRNVVAFEANVPTLPLLPPFLRITNDANKPKIKGFITVDVKGMPNPSDGRKIDVKFDACRVSLSNSPIDVNFPLGIVGPTGWLRTAYVDEEIRITRGHKGSVFILTRTKR